MLNLEYVTFFIPEQKEEATVTTDYASVWATGYRHLEVYQSHGIISTAAV